MTPTVIICQVDNFSNFTLIVVLLINTICFDLLIALGVDQPAWFESIWLI